MKKIVFLLLVVFGALLITGCISEVPLDTVGSESFVESQVMGSTSAIGETAMTETAQTPCETEPKKFDIYDLPFPGAEAGILMAMTYDDIRFADIDCSFHLGEYGTVRVDGKDMVLYRIIYRDHYMGFITDAFTTDWHLFFSPECENMPDVLYPSNNTRTGWVIDYDNPTPFELISVTGSGE